MATLRELIIKMSVDTAQVKRGMTEAEVTVKRSASTIIGAFAGVGAGIAAAFSVTAISATLGKIGTMQSELLKTAERLNTTTETLSSFSVFALKAGLSTQSFNTALTNMEKNISEAAVANETSTKSLDGMSASTSKNSMTLREMGLNAAILNKLPLDQQLLAISAAMQKNVPASDQARIGMQLFGVSSEAMVAEIKKGPEAIQKLIDRSNELGTVTTEAAKKADEAKTAAGELSIAWQNFAGALVGKVAPAITEIINKLTELIIMRDRASGGFPIISMGGTEEEKKKILDAIKRVQGGVLGGTAGAGVAGGGGGGWGISPWEKALETPTKNRPVGGGKAAGDMGLDRMQSIIDTLQKDLSRLTEGSLAEIREWANHMRNEIEKVGRKGAETEEAMALVANVEGKKKEKAVEDYYLFVAKESGDNYKQIEADAKGWLTKYKGFADAETNITAIKNRKIAEEDNRQMTERLSLRASLMNSIATEMPLLSQNLAVKEKLLPLEDKIARLTLERSMASLKLNEAQKDELRGLLAIANAAKKYSMEREKWATEGVSGGLKLFGLGKKQEGETNVAQATQKQFKDIEKSVATFIGKGIKSILFGQGKVDFAELGKEIASSFIDTAVELAVSKLFEALAATFLQSVLTTVPTEIATATSVAAIETTAATTSGGILISAGATVAAEIVAGATQAAAIMASAQAGGFFGLFHSGGVIRAHRGWPWLASDEVPIIAQTGERILSRRQNREFEAGMMGGRGGDNYYNNTNVTIQPRYPMSRQETEHMVRNKLMPALFKQQKRMAGRVP